jgi:hypothetical protein
MAEEHQGDGGCFTLDRGDDGWVISERPRGGPARHPWRPLGCFPPRTSPQRVPGPEGLQSPVWAYAGDSVGGEQAKHAWGVADGVPWSSEVELDEEVAWEQRTGVPGAIAPACGDQRKVGLEAAAVEFGVSDAFGAREGCGDAPDRTATARHLATIVGCCRVLLVWM